MIGCRISTMRVAAASRLVPPAQMAKTALVSKSFTTNACSAINANPAANTNSAVLNNCSAPLPRELMGRQTLTTPRLIGPASLEVIDADAEQLFDVLHGVLQREDHHAVPVLQYIAPIRHPDFVIRQDCPHHDPRRQQRG